MSNRGSAMSSGDPVDPVREMIDEYVKLVRDELRHRWQKWATTLTELEKYEGIGGLLARQVTLATQLAGTPSIWNPHLAPVILRTMVDTHITLAWILLDPLPRSRQFVLYGLGQNKLYVEHLKAWGEREGNDVADVVKALESWQDEQRFTFLTEVNLGSWAEMNTRKMAEEYGELDLYNLTYLPFSAATHSMWHHIARLNLIRCGSPLHRHHRVPVDADLPSDADYLYRAAKFVDGSFAKFDAALAIHSDVPSAFQALVRHLENFGREEEGPVTDVSSEQLS